MCTGGGDGGGGGGEQPKKKNPLKKVASVAAFAFNPVIGSQVLGVKAAAKAAAPDIKLPETNGAPMPTFSATDTERSPEVANAAAAEVARSRGKGRKATILTGALGLPGQAATTQKTLLGQ